VGFNQLLDESLIKWYLLVKTEKTKKAVKKKSKQGGFS
jgi:hypothetical protein